MTTEKTLLTAEDLFSLPDSCGHFELLDGKLIEMTPPGGAHNGVMGLTTYHLTAFVVAHDLGWVLPGDTGVILRRNPDRVRGPDVCFIAKERLPEGRLPRGYLEIVPDLIVEVVSPNDTASEVQQKTEEWLRAGARLVWTVYPDTRSVVVAEPPGEQRVLHVGDTLVGDPVLPGFSVAVSALFV